MICTHLKCPYFLTNIKSNIIFSGRLTHYSFTWMHYKSRTELKERDTSSFDDTALILPSTDHKVIGKLRLFQPSHVGDCHSIHLELPFKKHMDMFKIFNTIKFHVISVQNFSQCTYLVDPLWETSGNKCNAVHHHQSKVEKGCRR